MPLREVPLYLLAIQVLLHCVTTYTVYIYMVSIICLVSRMCCKLLPNVRHVSAMSCKQQQTIFYGPGRADVLHVWQQQGHLVWERNHHWGGVQWWACMYSTLFVSRSKVTWSMFRVIEKEGNTTWLSCDEAQVPTVNTRQIKTKRRGRPGLIHHVYDVR